MKRVPGAGPAASQPLAGFPGEGVPQVFEGVGPVVAMGPAEEPGEAEDEGVRHHRPVVDGAVCFRREPEEHGGAGEHGDGEPDEDAHRVVRPACPHMVAPLCVAAQAVWPRCCADAESKPKVYERSSEGTGNYHSVT